MIRVSKHGLCPTEDQLAQFRSGSLGQDEIDAVSEHIEDCDTCLQRLEELQPSHFETCFAQCNVLTEIAANPSFQRLVEHLRLAPAPTVSVGDGDTEDDLPEIGPCLESVGRFEIRRQLGEGGFGTVYLAFDPELDRYVAIKVPRHGTLIRDEARASARLKHSAIAEIYDVISAHGTDCVVMEFIEGESLEHLLQSGVPLTSQRTLQLMHQVALGVQAAHEAGIIHRDIKPSNIFVDNNGNARVLDFGLAQPSGSSTHGKLAGTPPYMSPEQARRQSVDERSDVWSIGATMFQCLTGKRPFGGGDREAVLNQVKNEPPRNTRPPLQDRHSEYAMEVCLSCLQKDKELRPQSAQELAGTIAAAQPRILRQRVAQFGVIAAAMLALLAAGVAMASLLPDKSILSRGLFGAKWRKTTNVKMLDGEPVSRLPNGTFHREPTNGQVVPADSYAQVMATAPKGARAVVKFPTNEHPVHGGFFFGLRKVAPHRIKGYFIAIRQITADSDPNKHTLRTIVGTVTFDETEPGKHHVTAHRLKRKTMGARVDEVQLEVKFEPHQVIAYVNGQHAYTHQHNWGVNYDDTCGLTISGDVTLSKVEFQF